jgi:RNA polymerase sigma-70 factor (ECF subfamily)
MVAVPATSEPEQPTPVGMAHLPTRDDPMDRALAAQAIKRKLATLGAEHRRVIIEIYYRGRSAAETAALLGVPVGAMKSRSYQALRSLRAAMGATGRDRDDNAAR